jgi:hypothetical protein
MAYAAAIARASKGYVNKLPERPKPAMPGPSAEDQRRRQGQELPSAAPATPVASRYLAKKQKKKAKLHRAKLTHALHRCGYHFPVCAWCQGCWASTISEGGRPRIGC